MTGFKLPSLKIYTLFYLFFLYAPILLLPLFAFNDGTIIAFPLKGFTTEWFGQMFANDTLGAGGEELDDHRTLHRGPLDNFGDFRRPRRHTV